MQWSHFLPWFFVLNLLPDFNWNGIFQLKSGNKFNTKNQGLCVGKSNRYSVEMYVALSAKYAGQKCRALNLFPLFLWYNQIWFSLICCSLMKVIIIFRNYISPLKTFSGSFAMAWRTDWKDWGQCQTQRGLHDSRNTRRRQGNPSSSLLLRIPIG